MTAALLAPVPPLTAPRTSRRFTVADRTLATGLRVLAVRRTGVPLVEVRLRIPMTARSTAHSARASLLSDTLLSGTTELSNFDIAIALQEIGGTLRVSWEPDRLLVSGNTLATGLPRLLDILRDVLTDAAYPQHEVVGQRSRLIEQLRIARSQPSTLAREVLLRRMYGDHPYAHELPEPGAVEAVTPAQLRSLHRSRVIPPGSTLIVVGDVSPQRVVDRVEATLSTWETDGRAATAPRLPRISPGPILLVDRPEAVQSNIRVGGAALRRQDPDYPAMQLANLVFGGYFSSRLVENIRERRGYTYSPHCRIDHLSAGSVVTIDADVATGVTAPALLEIEYELGRVATLPVEQEELDNARQYAIGSLALSTATQSGLANMLTSLLANDLGPEWIHEHPSRLAKVTVDEVLFQAARFLAPSRLVTVVLGDATAVRAGLSTLDEVVTE